MTVELSLGNDTRNDMVTVSRNEDRNNAAFDRWVDKSYKELYEPVLTEAIPQHMLDHIKGFQPEGLAA